MSFRTGPHSPFQLYNILGPFIDTTIGGGNQLKQKYMPLCQAWEKDPIAYEICHSLVQTDLLSLTDDCISITHGEADRKAVAKRITILLTLLRIVPSNAVCNVVSNSGQALTETWAKTMENVYRLLAAHADAYSTGLTPMCIEIARSLGSVAFADEHGEHRMTSMSPTTRSLRD